MSSSHLPSKPSLCSSCSPTHLLLSMKSELEKPFSALDPANEAPVCRPQPTAAPSAPLAPPSSPAMGRPTCSILASTFMSHVTHSCSTTGPPPSLSTQTNLAIVLPFQEVAGVGGWTG